ncbi:hypothetical protein Lal_00019654 [Lupinus albus]|nr:hypothetical protein Lal_00019654 [Lupinus albus]
MVRQDGQSRRKQNLAAKKGAEKAVSEARDRAYDELYKLPGSNGGGRSFYRLAKSKETRKESKRLGQVKCIKYEDGKFLVKDKDMNERWKN